MTREEEIQEELDDFFENTCIKDFVLNQKDPQSLFRVEKKTPIGIWSIKSVEIGYFIDMDDKINIGILDKGDKTDYQIVLQFLIKRAKKIMG